MKIDLKNLANHEPVLLEEVLNALNIPALLKKQPRGERPLFIDATVGLGGHSVEIIKRGGKVLGIDADGRALSIAEKKLKQACPTPYTNSKECYTLVNANFSKIDEIARIKGVSSVSGILFDLGVSSYQLTSPERGFSFRSESAALDMRLDRKNQGVTAYDLLNSLTPSQLLQLFAEILPYKNSKKLGNKLLSRTLAIATGYANYFGFYF